MMKPGLPKGTRDFSPIEMSGRNLILDTITGVYRLFGYQQIETPAMENLSTLTGKYGEEGDQLLYKILNSRLHDSRKKDQLLEAFKQSLERNTNSELLTERALRYDLTVPFARYVVMHRNDIQLPFKRYQVQPVWRADRPQKGRYREFYQCDADVIGSDSLLNEAELIDIIDMVFRKLEIPVTIKINNRKILAGIAELCEHPDMLIPITVAIDKLEKIGREKVIEELSGAGLSDQALQMLDPFFDFKGSTEEKLQFLRAQLGDTENGPSGIDEIEKMIGYSESSQIELDITLARGLNYYTGAIIEVKAEGTDFGSICGGGRYDDLTGIFGLPDVSGVGISFGIDRIYDVMSDKGAFHDLRNAQFASRVLILNFGPETENACLEIAHGLRDSGISTEYFPDEVKIKKQMNYANANRIPWVVMIGSDELRDRTASLKNMASGDQSKVPFTELADVIDADTNS
jgi:histidyl-tRNA synthetase